MRLDHVKGSENVDDRRGGGGKRMALGGGIGAILLAILAFFFKGDASGLVNQTNKAAEVQESGELSPAEKQRGEFAKKVLRVTEQIWNEIYPDLARAYPRAKSRKYQEPIMVLFTGTTGSGCGAASHSSGPFYCPADDRVYIDLSFFELLKQRFKAPGDFAQAYVIAHEVGHHIQNLLGIADDVHKQRRRLKPAAYNQLSVRMELQADYFAGVWAHRAERHFQELGLPFLEKGDIEEGLRAAAAIGDDRLQKQSQGYVVEESFTHGTSEQRVRWFTLGLKSGDPTAHNPFDVPYDQL